jgi:ankyrin repeat protein
VKHIYLPSIVYSMQVGRTPIHIAISVKDVEVVELLLERGAKADLPDAVTRFRCLIESWCKSHCWDTLPANLNPKPCTFIAVHDGVDWSF